MGEPRYQMDEPFAWGGLQGGSRPQFGGGGGGGGGGATTTKLALPAQ